MNPGEEKKSDFVIQMNDGQETSEHVNLDSSFQNNNNTGLKTVLCKEEKPRYLRKEYHQKLFKNPHETTVALALASEKKSNMPNWKIFILSIYGGLLVGVGAGIALIVGGGFFELYFDAKLFNSSAVATTHIPIIPKLFYSLTFPSALVLIVLLGSELFTGNTMYFVVGVMAKKVRYKDILKSWAFSLIGNYIGCVLMSLTIWGCGIFSNTYVQHFLFGLVEGKMSNNWGVTFFKAIPCNFLVCASLFMGIAAEDVISKIGTMWIGIFAFAMMGLEHCVANMFLFTVAALYGGNFNYGVFIYWHSIPSILGNIIGGGLFLGFIWWLMYYVSVEVPHHMRGQPHEHHKYLAHTHHKHDANVNYIYDLKSATIHFFGDCFDVTALVKAWRTTDPDPT